PDCIAGPFAAGVFRTAAGVSQTVVLAGAATPLGPATSFSRFTGAPQINSGGSVAFFATVTGAASTEAVFVSPAFVALAVRGDGVPPDGGGGSIGQIKAFRLDSSNRAVVLSNIASSRARSGLFRYDGTIPGRTTVATRATAPVPPFAAGAKYSL